MGSEVPQRPVLGFHVNFGCYGFWLPNDPRGSNSEYVRTVELLEFGKATKVEDRRNVARKAHDWKARLEAKKHLKYPAVVLDGKQALAAAHGFADVVRKNGYVVHAPAPRDRGTFVFDRAGGQPDEGCGEQGAIAGRVASAREIQRSQGQDPFALAGGMWA